MNLLPASIQAVRFYARAAIPPMRLGQPETPKREYFPCGSTARTVPSLAIRMPLQHVTSAIRDREHNACVILWEKTRSILSSARIAMEHSISLQTQFSRGANRGSKNHAAVIATEIRMPRSPENYSGNRKDTADCFVRPVTAALIQFCRRYRRTIISRIYGSRDLRAR